MKKVLLSAALMLIGMGAFAQTSFGVKVGANLSNQSFKEGSEKETGSAKLGLNLGVVAQMPINDMFSFAPELIFSSKGYKEEDSESESGMEYSYEYKEVNNYLEAPLLVRGTFAERFYVNAGPTLGYWLGGKVKGEESYTFMGDTETESFEGKIKFVDEYSEADDEVQYLKDNVNRFEFGVAIGGGVAVTEGVLVDLRYTQGLTSQIKSEGDEDYSIKNNNISLSLIYMFNK